MDDDVQNFVLDRCVDAMLNGGLDVETCLSIYPAHKDELHPLLEAVGILRPLRTTPVPSGAKARIWAHLKAQAGRQFDR
jgi:hypothetical protein